MRARESDLDFIRRPVRRLIERGSVEAVADDIVAEAGHDGVHVVDPNWLGMALRTLGARSYRTRRGNRQLRVYDLLLVRLDSRSGVGTG